MFGATSNLMAAVGSVMMDLSRLSPTIADVFVVFHDGKLNARDQQILSSIHPCHFEEYVLPIDDLSVFSKSTIRRFSPMVFSKFECFRLLKEYRSVMWLDYDIVVQSDISDLLTRGQFDAKFLPGNVTVRDQLYAELLSENAFPEYDLNAEGICGSTFVLFDSLPDHQQIHAFCYDALLKYSEYLYLGEQAIFDFLIQQYSIQHDNIDPSLHTPHPTDSRLAPKARIIHAYGPDKFWDRIHNSQWEKNYERWIELGGSPISKARHASGFKQRWHRIRRKLGISARKT